MRHSHVQPQYKIRCKRNTGNIKCEFEDRRIIWDWQESKKYSIVFAIDFTVRSNQIYLRIKDL